MSFHKNQRGERVRLRTELNKDPYFQRLKYSFNFKNYFGERILVMTVKNATKEEVVDNLKRVGFETMGRIHVTGKESP